VKLVTLALATVVLAMSAGMASAHPIHHRHHHVVHHRVMHHHHHHP
jgi:hypothetical protein